MSVIIDSIRQQIDAKHQEALDALKVLEGYIQQSSQPTAPPPHEANGASLSSPTASPVAPLVASGSMTERVLSAITKNWVSASQIRSVTRLTPRQIRGVLYRKDIRDKIEKKEANGQVVYRLRTEERSQ